MLVAEELECDWRKVRVEYASTPTSTCGASASGATWRPVGSRTIRNSQEYLRKGGATAREMLIAAAAQGWGVPAVRMRRRRRASSRTRRADARRPSARWPQRAAKLEAAQGREAQGPEGLEARSAPRSARRHPGDTVRASSATASTRSCPAWCYAAIAQCPVFGGKVKIVDDSAKIQGRARHHQDAASTARLGRGRRRQLVARQPKR